MQVNLNSPDQVILVQVTRNAVGASVVTRYKELHKFNMRKCADVSMGLPTYSAELLCVRAQTQAKRCSAVS